MICYSLLFCISAYLLAGTEAALDAEGIVGGDEDTTNVSSYQIALVPTWNGGEIFCGGAIIGDRHILTAAHCVTEGNAVFTEFPKGVVAGVFDLEHKGPRAVQVGVKKVYIPREYEGEGKIGDIAVLKLKRSLNLSDNQHLRKVELPQAGKSYVGLTAMISGYGWTWSKLNITLNPLNVTETGGNDSFKKKISIADVVSNTQCQVQNHRQTISDKQICAQMHQRLRNEGVCNGDSGGPLVLFNSRIIIGVLSNSRIGCDESVAAAVYTRVSSYLDFINNAIAGNVTRDMRVYTYPKRLRVQNLTSSTISPSVVYN